MSHEDLYHKAELAVKEVYNDISVSKSEIRASLEVLLDEIEVMLDALGE